MLVSIKLNSDIHCEVLWTQMLRVLQGFSPTLEVVSTDTLIVDLGVMTDHRKIRAEGQRIVDKLTQEVNQSASLGLAEGRFVASVAASLAPPGQCIVVFAGEEASFLESQPVSLLPVESETLRRLQLLGIATVGQVARLSEDDLANLFGREGALMASLASGRDESLIAGEKIVEKLSISTQFDFPLEENEHVFGTIAAHLEELCVQLQKRLQLATRVLVSFNVADHPPTTVVLNLASPGDNASRLIVPLRNRFIALTLPGPIEGLSVELEGFVDSYARQLTLESLLPKAHRWRTIDRVLQRLSVRADAATLMQVVWTDARSRIPERRGHFQDLVDRSLRRSLYPPKPVKVAANDVGLPRLVYTSSGWESVDAIMEAWEIDDEWWTTRPIMRNYYRVILRNGTIMRLFRDQRRGLWYHQNR